MTRRKQQKSLISQYYFVTVRGADIWRSVVQQVSMRGDGAASERMMMNIPICL